MQTHHFYRYFYPLSVFDDQLIHTAMEKGKYFLKYDYYKRSQDFEQIHLQEGRLFLFHHFSLSKWL
jgi:hypothetical protein